MVAKAELSIGSGVSLYGSPRRLVVMRPAEVFARPLSHEEAL